jgi:Ca2+-binding RTX toxin-like protein
MDFNDTLAQAIDTNLSNSNPGTFETFGYIGDNEDVPDGEDVDLYKVQLNAGDGLSVDTIAQTYGLNSVLRVFDASGNQVAFSDDTFPNDTFSTDSQIDFTATTAGTYYIGVSSSDNTEYDPEIEGSGSNSSTSNTIGSYQLNVEVAPLKYTGTSGDDVFVGSNASNTINGLGGDDDLVGRGGNDTINGGAGDDLIDGGNGEDSLLGGIGDDQISGAAGNDTIRGGAGIDVINGGAGYDSLVGGNGKDRIKGEAGDDFINGGADNDNLDGGDGYDTILGGAGNDNIVGGDEPVDDYYYYGGDNISGEAGNDRINGGGGYDIISGGDGNDNLFGGNDSDTLSGDNGADSINGGSGYDSLNGGAGNDTLNGGNDSDTLVGEAGADRLVGGSGYDSIDGGAGNDTLIGVSTTTGFGLYETDYLTGGKGADTFVLGDANRIYYSDGNPATKDNYDYAQIFDFNASQDVIQLKGSADVYRLDFFTANGSTGANLIYDTGANDKGEIIGRLENVADTLTLTSPAFVFL